MAQFWDLTPRQLCDLELLLNGGFAPLTGFLTRQEYESVCRDMRFPNGALWPIPVTLDVSESLAKSLKPGTSLALRDPEGVMLAALHVEDVWQPDRMVEAEAIFGHTTREHPGVAELLDRSGTWSVGGRVEGVRPPLHYDFPALRRTPAELRAAFAERGWKRVVAFQTRNPLHRAHYELTVRAAKEASAKLLIHPVVGMTKPGDVDHYTRVRCYEAIMGEYPPDLAMLSLLPLAMRMAGPREALWHAIIRKNYGCTHLIVGRDHAGPGKDSTGKPFYQPYAAQELVRKHEAELGITMVPFAEMRYLPGEDRFLPEDEVPRGARTEEVSGTELRRRLQDGVDLPKWFTFPAVERELRASVETRRRQGFTVFFTGLPSAGKSTVANVLTVKLLEAGERGVTLLDGDIVRKQFSAGLGFSREDRDTNIRRIGAAALEITRQGGIAICAPIAPYDATRREVRAMVEPHGGFVLVWLSTPIAVCEARDPKGLYAKARAGVVQHFTGVSDPYEPPADANVVLDTTTISPEDCAREVLDYLARAGLVTASQSPR